MSNVDIHECIGCENFGSEGEECGRCGSGTGSFFIGRRLSSAECDEKREAMDLEEEEECNRTFDDRKEHIYRKVVVFDKYGIENNDN